MKKKLIKKAFILCLSTPCLAKASSPAIVELNPILLINQGLGLNTEYLVHDKISLGADFEIFRQNPYMANDVTANRYIYSAAPKINYYLFSNEIYGPFLGFQLDFVYSESSISDADTKAQSNIFYVAPVVQIGYRFVYNKIITISTYVGLSYKSHENNFENSNIPDAKINNTDWLNAQTKLNKGVSRIQPELGFTFGFMF